MNYLRQNGNFNFDDYPFVRDAHAVVFILHEAVFFNFEFFPYQTTDLGSKYNFFVLLYHFKLNK